MCVTGDLVIPQKNSTLAIYHMAVSKTRKFTYLGQRNPTHELYMCMMVTVVIISRTKELMEIFPVHMPH